MTHEEAIEVLKKKVEYLESDKRFKAAVETLIPELADSEDERMINKLQGFLSSFGADYFGTGEWQQFDTWLEKQKESLHIQEMCKENAGSFTDEDEGIRKAIIELLKEMGRDDTGESENVKCMIAYLERQKINTEGDFGRGYDCGYEACLNSHGAEWFEKQKELPFVKDVMLGYPGLYFYDGERMHFQGNPAMEENPMCNLEIPAGDVAPAEEDGPFDEDEFLDNELSAFLQNYDKEYDDDAAVSDVAKHFYEIGKKQKEQKPTEPGPMCGGDDYDKGYRDGREYQLRQVEQYSIGKTFIGLIPCWINAPSTLQPAHRFHGRNAVIMHENNGGFRCVLIDDEKAAAFHLPENTLFVEGWRKKPAEWSEEDEKIINDACCWIAEYAGYLMDKNYSKASMLMSLTDKLKSLRPQPHIVSTKDAIKFGNLEYERGVKDGIQHSENHRWKPSEEQMEALEYVIRDYREDSCNATANYLQEILDHLKNM